MDGDCRPSVVAAHALRSASVAADHPMAIPVLSDALGRDPLSLVLLYCSPKADFRSLVSHATVAFPEARVVACTTAGEIDETGYAEDRIVAIGLPKAGFDARSILVKDLDKVDHRDLIGRLILARSELGASRLELPHEFALVLIDGLSRQEDQLVGCLPPGLGPVPLFGGSAGDGARFENTLLAIDGTIHRHAAVLTLVRSLSPVRVFSHDHFAPTSVRMVVTRADPANRIVSQINAEPAAAEYARLVGKDPGQLSPFTFAAHPVVVRLGGRHHVRSIQQVTPSGDLVFFSAIDEGVVLTVAEPCDMASHLSSKLEELARPAQPDALLVCDCILRRIEAGEKQMTNRISRLLSEHRVTGFSTYGEQFGAMHVNQTMTGVAFYPPGTELSA